ncbi:HAMP domain-containing sensor histidine kinase [uncultured Tateyamaria sp.]|uniref:sensor histidine kinase n=1 Tax=Tateyamaria sp. 1078 TaxID=3417464 RepID=UPI0026324C23|nr:HAMP domain-containing sensor histidine kinase [uncultured Tateyamaria sp.]
MSPDTARSGVGAAEEAPEHSLLYEAKVARAAFVAMPSAAFLLDDAARIVLHTRRAGRLYPHQDAQHDTGLEGIAFWQLTHLDEPDLRRALRNAISSGLITLPMNNPHRVDVPKDVTFHLSLMRIKGVRRQLYMLSQDHLRASATALQTANMMREQESNRGLHLEAHISTLQNSVMSMETFANAASHDLKTPINALSGLLELFCAKFENDLPPEAEPYLKHMQGAVVQMDALTTKLMAHAQSSAAPMEMRQIHLNDTVQSVLDLLDPALRDNAEDIALSGPKFDLMAEPTMLHILLGNIVSNALKHGHADRPLRITLTTEVTGTSAVLRISDTGTGFAPDQNRAIFTPFTRLKSNVQGSGLGLATCAEICRRHNWDISAVSDGQSGATFKITFPTILKV